MTKQTPITKLTHPNISGIVPRKRLFRLLDQFRDKPVVWVSGPAGSGKTTLVTSYLDARKFPCLWYSVDAGDEDIATFFYYMGLASKKAAPRYKKALPLLRPEYLRGITSFTQRFFEAFYSRLKPPFAIVFDNYQAVPSDSVIHDIVANALSLIPEGMQIFTLSRNEAPSSFARLRANGRMHLIGWDEIRFTFEESKLLLQLKEKWKLNERTVEELYELTGGWVAGLLLLTEGAGPRPSAGQMTGKGATKEVFDYFAGEVLDKLDSDSRDFLLLTSCLPLMTAETAKRLTDHHNAGDILNVLSRNHFFTVKHQATEPTFKYHPLFREFLLSRLRESLSHKGIIRVQKRAASLLEEAGQIEDAAELYMQVGEGAGLVRLILAHARSLVEQGRGKTLEVWLSRLPETYRENDPWILYWSGICRVPFDPAEGRRYLERAFKKFSNQRNETGMLLAWSNIVETFLYEFTDFTPLDSWIAWLDRHHRTKPAYPNSDVQAVVMTSMATALVWRQLQRRDIKSWVERAVRSAEVIHDINLQLRAYTLAIQYYAWIGDLGTGARFVNRMKRLAESSQASPLARITWKWSEGVWLTLAESVPDRVLLTVSEGLHIAEASGMHIFDMGIFLNGVYASFNKGDLTKTKEYLDHANALLHPERSSALATYYFVSGFYGLLTNDLSRASKDAEQSLSISMATGVPCGEFLCRLLSARVAFETEPHSDAMRHIHKAKRLARQIKSTYMEFVSLLTEAYFTMQNESKRGDTTEKGAAFISLLRRAMKIGREQGYKTLLFIWSPEILSRLCSAALRSGIEVGYVLSLIRELRLPPSTLSHDLDAWPWPVKARTFGRFELAKDGKPVQFSGKVQRKPLDLLKVLIAFGGRDVSEERIIDALWPEAPGDLAHKSFEMTLQRLRRLIGIDKVLRLQDGLLTLDDRLCWVDTWAFERMFERLEFGGSEEPGLPSPCPLTAKKGDKARRKSASIQSWKTSILGNPQSAMEHREKVISLYRGHFLPADSRQPWSVITRERLRSKFLHLVTKTGEQYEQDGEWKKAVVCFEQGLEKDAVCEEFYQHLMLCHNALGHRAEAVNTYQRCRAVLRDRLGLDPSSRTEELHSSVRWKG